MDDAEVIDKFALLFQGNLWRIGTERGGSIDIEHTWHGVCEDHLRGISPPIGAYPIDPRTQKVRWGCVDFDEGEEASLRHAQRLEWFLARHRIASAVERSRSKGYHVWVFVKPPYLDAKIMRRALLYACEFVGAPTKEINPKQETVNESSFGNYVRLPYPSMLGDDWNLGDAQGLRRVIIDTRTQFDASLRQFIEQFDALGNDPGLIADLAIHYTPKPNTSRNSYTSLSVEDSVLPEDYENLNRSARRLLENGPKHSDRSSALVALAGDIARHQIDKDPQQCLTTLVVADARWGKYYIRNDHEMRLTEIVNRVYDDLERY